MYLELYGVCLECGVSAAGDSPEPPDCQEEGVVVDVVVGHQVDLVASAEPLGLQGDGEPVKQWLVRLFKKRKRVLDRASNG